MLKNVTSTAVITTLQHHDNAAPQIHNTTGD